MNCISKINEKIEEYCDDKKSFEELKKDLGLAKEKIDGDLDFLLKDSQDEIKKLEEDLMKIEKEDSDDTKATIIIAIETRKLKDELVAAITELEERTIETESNIGI